MLCGVGAGLIALFSLYCIVWVVLGCFVWLLGFGCFEVALCLFSWFVYCLYDCLLGFGFGIVCFALCLDFMCFWLLCLFGCDVWLVVCFRWVSCCFICLCFAFDFVDCCDFRYVLRLLSCEFVCIVVFWLRCWFVVVAFPVYLVCSFVILCLHWFVGWFATWVCYLVGCLIEVLNVVDCWKWCWIFMLAGFGLRWLLRLLLTAFGVFAVCLCLVCFIVWFALLS